MYNLLEQIAPPILFVITMIGIWGFVKLMDHLESKSKERGK